MLGYMYSKTTVILKEVCIKLKSDPTQLILAKKVIHMYICRTKNMASRAITHESEEPERSSWHHQGPGWSRRIVIRQVAEAVMGNEARMTNIHEEGEKEPKRGEPSKKKAEGPETEPEKQKTGPEKPAKVPEAPEAPEKVPDRPDDGDDDDDVMIIDIIEDGKGEPSKNRVVTWSGPPTRKESKSAGARNEGKDNGGRHGGGRGQIIERVRESNRKKKAWKDRGDTEYIRATHYRGTTPNFRPPNLPGGYGSRQYPAYEINDDVPGPLPPFEYMSTQNRWRQDRERQHMMERKYQDYLNYGKYLTATRQGVLNNRPYCSVCSEIVTEAYPDGKMTYHNHYSSKEYRMEAALTDLGEYDCDTCEISPHTYKSGQRVALLITSSTLSNWQNILYTREGVIRQEGYEGDELHVDHLAVPGATIRELQHAFEAEYDGYWRPIDVIFCGGINNVLQGQSVEQIITELQTFKELVKRVGWNSGHENTFAVTTMIFPPAVTRLAYDEPCMKPGWVNRVMDIIKINDYIIRLNESGEDSCYTRHVPRLHCYGLKKVIESESNEAIRSSDVYISSMNMHRRAAWREWAMDDMIHLSDHYRLVAGKSINRYLARIYGITNDEDLNRLEEQMRREQEEIERERERSEAAQAELREQEERERREEEERARNEEVARRRMEMVEREKAMLRDLVKYRKQQGKGGKKE